MRQILGAVAVLGIGFNVIISAIVSDNVELSNAEQLNLRGGYWGGACVSYACVNCVPPNPMTHATPGCTLHVPPTGGGAWCFGPNNGVMGCGITPAMLHSRCDSVFGGSGCTMSATLTACGGVYMPKCENIVNALGVVTGCDPKCLQPSPVPLGSCPRCTL